MAQVGFLVHQIAFLEPAMGRTGVATAVAVLTIAAFVGRIVFGVFIQRLDARRVAALSLLAQAVALLAMTQTTETSALLVACAVFGLAAGNLITLPALIIQREFETDAFGMLVGLSTAIGQFIYAFGPGLLGIIRDATGSYTAALVLCMALEIAAAAWVLARPRRWAVQQAPVDFR
jgi:cyanate permease